MDERKIARISVIFDDGTLEVYNNNEELILAIVNEERDVFKVETTRNVDIYTVLDFAQSAIRDINEEIDANKQPIKPTKKERPNHLKVVK